MEFNMNTPAYLKIYMVWMTTYIDIVKSFMIFLKQKNIVILSLLLELYL